MTHKLSEGLGEIVYICCGIHASNYSCNDKLMTRFKHPASVAEAGLFHRGLPSLHFLVKRLNGPYSIERGVWKKGNYLIEEGLVMSKPRGGHWESPHLGNIVT